MKGYLTVIEFAEKAGCTRAWIAYLIKDGFLTADKTGGRYLIKESEFQKYGNRKEILRKRKHGNNN